MRGAICEGDVIVLPFPFSDLSGSKKRPAFVLADLPGNDLIVCQITGKNKSDPIALSVLSDDFGTGALPVTSFVRPNKIFTADKNLVLYVAGHLSETKTREILNAVIRITSY